MQIVNAVFLTIFLTILGAAFFAAIISISYAAGKDVQRGVSGNDRSIELAELKKELAKCRKAMAMSAQWLSEASDECAVAEWDELGG